MPRSAARTFLVVLLLAGSTSDIAARPRHHHRVRRAAPTQGYGEGYGYGYGRRYDPTPTCRYADGTPFDPDIIGGPNHVGAGGPAANLGGFYPCGF